MRPTLLVASAISGACVFSACVPAKDPEKIGPYPGNYKAAVAADMKTRFFDPYSLRDVSIAEPREGHMLMQQGWIVCVRANGKNRMGAYVGMKDTAFLVNNGRVLGASDDFPACADLKFSPWPEMDSGPKPRA